MSIVLKGIKKSFGKKKVLQDINLTLEDNGIYCLMGPSGMGKTTLMRILLNREKADSGTVTGIHAGEISAMFQEDRLCPSLSAVQNVALVCDGKVDEKALLQELEQILPANCLQQPVAQLSGGMKRRVALARAMHYPCRMIVLDEPFTGLDQNTRLEVIQYLLKMRKDRILLVATHGVNDASLLGAKVIRLDRIQGHEEKDEQRIDRTMILKNMQMFRGIRPDRLEELVNRLGGYERSYREQDVIWNQEEQYKAFGIILEGSIQPADISRKEPQIIRRFDAGSCFGEAVAFGTQRSWVEIRAVMQTRILFIPAVNILNHNNDPEIVQVMSNLLVELSTKFAAMNYKNHMLTEPRLRSRLLMYFNTLNAAPNGIRTMPFGQKELAQYLNVNRSALNRELARMKEEEIIEMDGRSVRILRNESEWIEA